MLVRLLRTYLRRYRRLLLVLVGLQGVQALAGLYLPFLNADVIDKGVMRGDTAYIWRMGGFMLGVTAVQLVFTVLAVYLGSRMAMGFGRDVRDALFHRVTGFSAREMNRFGAPSLITRITNDVQQVQMLVVMACNLALAAPITVIGGVVMAIRQDGGLAWLLAVSMPIMILAMGAVVLKMVPTFRVMQDRIDGINRVLREQITGIRVVRAFVREREETHRFDGANSELTTTSLTAGRLMTLFFPIVMLVINGSSVAVIWFGGNRIADGSLSIGALIAFLSYFVLILMSVMMATFVASMAPRAAVCADRIQEVLSTDSSVWAPRLAGGGPRVDRVGGVLARDLPVPRSGGAGPVGRVVRHPGRHHHRHHRLDRRRQDDARQPGRPPRRCGRGWRAARRRRHPHARP